MQKEIIKNKKELSTNPLRKDALDILETGYQAVLTENILAKSISLKKDILKIQNKKYNLSDYKNVFVIAFGKCANQSALFIESILEDKITDGIVLDVELEKFKKLKSQKGSHPLPSEKNIKATNLIKEISEKAGKDDLVLVFISGGGSALLSSPVEGIDSEFLAQINKDLMDNGVSIGETNIIRKHLSRIKGGALAELIYPAKLVSIIFSDVPGDDISVVASGPTVRDLTTKEDAKMILESYSLENPKSSLGEAISFLSETPKSEEKFENVDNILLVTNKIALEAIEKKADELGYKSLVESFDIQGEARKLSVKLVNEDSLDNSCRIFGGETTVKIIGEGKGGRNQEFALASLETLSKDILVLAVASDGRDNSDVAGAFVDFELFQKMQKEDLDWREYLDDNNSFEFFEKMGTQIKTGKTGINVADFYLILRK
ncbi:MAG: DUF4147 domain-containing protein [Candidatus Pacebacteria bacterium]|nr:DUF4147 domain-containing protein [Candidatus Paceibacterota bacterium]